MEFKDIYENIDWKPLALGGTIFVFIVILAVNYKLDILLMFSSIGLLYIGYTSQNRLQAVVLGSMGTIPLGIATFFFQPLRQYIGGENAEILIIISFLAIGACCGFAGLYFKSRRKKAFEEKMKQQTIGKGKKRIKKNNK